MKKLISALVVSFFCVVYCLSFATKSETTVVAEGKPMLAIVIDDFGQSRLGVEEMLKVNCKLTCAVMPGLDYSEKDANLAHSNGHEIILHMPMEAYVKLPDSWYGPKVIRNYDTPEKAKQLLGECIEEIPHCVGVNIHIGSGVCLNKKLVKAILEETRDKGKYFLDSRTHEGSVCAEIAPATNTDFVKRDFFLEPTNAPNYLHAKNELLKACELAKKQGYAIAIGHVGPEGGVSTANAIKDALEEIEQQGVDVVPLSKIVNKLNYKNKLI